MLSNYKNLKVSFEFFPPKSEKMEQSLWHTFKRLEPLKPQFVSVTYGAMGSTRKRTHELVSKIKKESKIQPAAHLTCVNSTKEELIDIADTYWNEGIKHIVALRGDRVLENGNSINDQLNYATDLIKILKSRNDFEITVSAYPEGHPESDTTEKDYDVLKRKIDLGATRGISQFFLDTDIYLKFLENIRKRNINIPIIPGILPVTNCKKTIEFSNSMNCNIPNWLKNMFIGLDSDPETRKLVAATIAAEQCMRLLKEGIKEFHFYTLNRADLTFAICHILGIRTLQD
ncbi:MAG: methylenetetrahydrofolate reductase [NAD(P)H] [Rickettsiales bacterium]|nr:methylenetetrahydrofolate reductase [NAD(P)H] [Rickettsiales bacterium]OUV53171.1 MAG: methylenetetrahydrofolate reductase [NAD(P)H] [Rickettsiales bacterium TMED127]|tara:strand:+ start:28 stop:888 length:861 start_codon:yes stop_codon:yes gene_type:complete